MYRSLLILLFLPSTVSFAQTPISTATVSSTPLKEVVDGSGAPLPVAVSQLPIDFFDDYSWRMFIALNWPALAGQRGVPDTSLGINDVSRQRVWETWKSAFEAIPPKGKQPTPWSSFDAEVPINGVGLPGGGSTKIFGSFTKFGDISQADFSSLAGPLVCQNNTFAHYEIRVNQLQFEFIRSNRFYDRDVLDNLPSSVSFPNGSVEVKAAWREFTAADDVNTRKRYYRVTARAQDYRDGSGISKEFGLIGLHIVQKTPLRPQWVWSSFEHVDNVPAFGQAPTPGSKFALNNSDPTAQALNPPSATDAVKPSTYLTAGGDPIITFNGGTPAAIPMQVVRKLPIAIQTSATNQRYQNKLVGTVWANYMLVTTQWPTDPSTPDGQPFPSDPSGASSDISVANTTMETYFQNSTSCMTCHHLFGSNKLDFVFFPSVHAQNQDPGLAGSGTASFVDRMNIEFKNFRVKSTANDAKRLGTNR